MPALFTSTSTPPAPATTVATAAAGVEIDLVELDVAEDASVAQGFEEIFAKTDRVDVLVNNAGIGGNAVAEVERWLAPVLAYDPEPADLEEATT